MFEGGGRGDGDGRWHCVVCLVEDGVGLWWQIYVAWEVCGTAGCSLEGGWLLPGGLLDCVCIG